MSIEKMNMLNLVGHKDELDRVSKLLVLSKTMHLVDGMEEIYALEKKDEAVIDEGYLKLFTASEDYTLEARNLKKIREICTVPVDYEPKESELILDHEELKNVINNLHEDFYRIHDRLEDKSKKRTHLLETIEYMDYLSTIETSIAELEGLNNFSFEVFKVSKEKHTRLKENYENIPSIVLTIFKAQDYEVVAAFTPKLLKSESDKIFKSLNCQTIIIAEECKGTPRQVIWNLKRDLMVIEKDINLLKEQLEALSQEKTKVLAILEKSLELEMKAQQIKNSMACTNEFFYLSGWVPEGNTGEVEGSLGDYNEKLIVVERSSKEVEGDIVPPTKLKNNFIMRPFEVMVSMYGVPSYSESDPTAYFGFSYMLLFGAMFGDLGQGLIFILAGLFLKYKQRRTNLGPIVVRLGISSSIFGLLYGSVFGFEHAIPALLIHPMENITETLIYAIVLGVCLLVSGFIISMINNFKRRDLEDGVFGKDGAAGLVFYLSLLAFALLKVSKIDILPGGVWAAIFIILLMFNLFKEPLANLIKNKRPLIKEEAGEYFIEGAFGLIECLLSIFSNTISFVRVGAFALNHVGLFLAFSTLAEMTHSKSGSVLMYILGNIIIIGIEGLVVFIQGMRLEYYELFGKYYEGDGVPYEPIGLTRPFKFKNIKLAERFKGFNVGGRTSTTKQNI